MIDAMRTLVSPVGGVEGLDRPVLRCITSPRSSRDCRRSAAVCRGGRCVLNIYQNSLQDLCQLCSGYTGPKGLASPKHRA